MAAQHHTCRHVGVHTIRLAHIEAQTEYVTLSSAPTMFIVSEFKHGKQISHIIRHIIIDISSITTHTQKFTSVLMFQLPCLRFRYCRKKPGWVRRYGTRLDLLTVSTYRFRVRKGVLKDDPKYSANPCHAFIP